MTISGKTFTPILLFFFAAAPTPAATKSPVILPSGNQSCPTNYPIEYSLLFENCNPKYNSETYYSSALQHLSYIYLAFTFLYLLFLGFWTSICLKIKPPFRKIYFLMAGLILMKAVSLICDAKGRYYEMITGSRTGSDLLNFVRQIVSSLRLLNAIVLIGTGFPHLNPILEETDKTVLMILIPIQGLGHVASIFMGESNELSTMLLDVISPITLLIPVACSILSIFPIDGWGFVRLVQVRCFYVIVMAYGVAVKGFMSMEKEGNSKLNAIDAYYYLLKSNFAVEAMGFFFHVMIFTMFRTFFKYYG